MFGCEVCTKVYTAKRSLTAHIKSKHNGITFVCNICLTSFTRKYELNKPTKNEHRESVIQYEPPVIVTQPPATTIASTTIPTTESDLWGDDDDVFIETLADFKNQGKKIHYQPKY